MRYVVQATDEESLRNELERLDLNIDEVSYRKLTDEEKKETGVEEGYIIEERAPERAARVTRRLLYLMAFKAKVKAIETEDLLRIEIDGENLAPLIGSGGTTLMAFQAVLAAIINKGAFPKKRVYLDICDYRKKREEHLQNLALRVAKQVKETGKPVSLKPMSAYERKIIHTILTDFEGVTTESHGEEPERYVTIKPE